MPIKTTLNEKAGLLLHESKSRKENPQKLTQLNLEDSYASLNNKLQSPPMLADRRTLFECSIINFYRFFRKHLVIGQEFFSAFHWSGQFFSAFHWSLFRKYIYGPKRA